MSDDKKTDFRPCGPGWFVQVSFAEKPEDGLDDPSDLVGWTWVDGAWCPTYWQDEMYELDVINPRDADYHGVHVSRDPKPRGYIVP